MKVRVFVRPVKGQNRDHHAQGPAVDSPPPTAPRAPYGCFSLSQSRSHLPAAFSERRPSGMRSESVYKRHTTSRWRPESSASASITLMKNRCCQAESRTPRLHPASSASRRLSGQFRRGGSGKMIAVGRERALLRARRSRRLRARTLRPHRWPHSDPGPIRPRAARSGPPIRPVSWSAGVDHQHGGTSPSLADDSIGGCSRRSARQGITDHDREGVAHALTSQHSAFSAPYGCFSTGMSPLVPNTTVYCPMTKYVLVDPRYTATSIRPSPS